MRRLAGVLALTLAATLLGAAPAPARAAAGDPALVTLRSTDGGFSFQPWSVGVDGAHRRLTPQSALSQPAVSPDGSTLAFAGPIGNSDSRGRYALFTIRLDGSNLRQVTAPRFGDLDPAWSPDGRALVFTRSTDGSLTTACCELWTVNTDGSGQRAVPNTRGGRQGVFTVDGGAVVFVGPGGLRMAALSGSGQRLLAAGAYADPSVSPDGREVAVSLLRSAARSDLGAVNLSSGAVRQVTTSAGRVEDPQWSSDSRTLYYLEHAGQGYLGRERSGIRALAAADGSGRRTVTAFPGEMVELAVAPSAHAVVGALEVARRGLSSARVAGWALDPDTADPVTVVVTVDGAVAAEAVADRPRPDVGSRYPSNGPAHGYDLTVELAPGDHRVCVVARDAVAPGPAQVQLGCATLSGAPFGVLDVLRRAPGGALAAGWVIDPDTAEPVAVDVTVDGRPVLRTSADGDRPDVERVHPGWGPRHGYSVAVPVGGGRHEVCVTAPDPDGLSAARSLGCRSLVVDGTPFGSYDLADPWPGGFRVGGWARDLDVAGPVTVHARVDGALVAGFVADGTRPDIERLFPGYGPEAGFHQPLAVPAGRHRVCLYLINSPQGFNPELGCRTVSRSDVPRGSFDLAARTAGGTRVAGWALDPDTALPVKVHVYVDGRLVTGAVADRDRSDIDRLFPGWGPAHGFDLVVPAQGARVCVYAINRPGGTNPLLGCRTT